MKDQINDAPDAGAANDKVENLKNAVSDANTGTHVYEGKPDDRQSSDVGEKLSRFRPKYRALTDDEKALHDEIKSKAVELEELIEKIKGGAAGRYKSMALTDLEKSVMWAVKELTA